MPTEELKRKEKQLEVDFLNFEKRDSAMKQTSLTWAEQLKREKEDHALKLRELKIRAYSSKKTLKEMGEIMKRETVNLVRISRKKELKINHEIKMVQLVHFREAEGLLLRRIGLCEEVEVSYREKYAGGNKEESKLQKLLLLCRELKEQDQKDLLNVREQIRVFEERATSIGKELDAVNLALVGDDEGRAIIIPYMAVSDPNPSNPNAVFLNSQSNRECVDFHSAVGIGHKQPTFGTSIMDIVAAIRSSKVVVSSRCER